MRPILFYLPFDVPVYSYGVMLGISCVVGAHLAVYLCGRSGIDPKKAWWLALAAILLGILGGRLHELAVQGKLFSSAALAVKHSGRTAYGGFVLGTLSAVVAARVLKVSFWRFADAAAPTMALGLGITRIGCFLYGCDYGFRSDSVGVAFPPGSPACTDHFEAGLIPSLSEPSLPVFPAQIPSSLVGLSIFGLLLWAWFRRPRRAGSVFLLFGLTYGLARAGLEQLRSDTGRGTLLGLSTSTTIGLLTATASLALLLIPHLARLRPDAGEVLPPWEDDAADDKPDGSAS